MRSTDRKESPQAEGTELSSKSELRRERQLVSSAGSISKAVMSLAFGIVLAVTGVLAVSVSEGWILGTVLAGIGAICILWAMYAWIQQARQHA